MKQAVKALVSLLTRRGHEAREQAEEILFNLVTDREPEVSRDDARTIAREVSGWLFEK